MRIFLYLDPGAGSLFLQLLMAGIAGITYLVARFWKRILGVFKRNQNTEVEDE